MTDEIYFTWLLSDKMEYDQQYAYMMEHQQEIEEFPLFFWRETCKEIKDEV